MNRRRPLRPVTADYSHIIDVNELNRLGAFKRPSSFPFRRLRTYRDRIEFYWPSNPRKPPQINAIVWTGLSLGGARPWFVCYRCHRRCGKLYVTSIDALCRKCADLWFVSQRQRRRERLKAKAHRIRVSLGDYSSRPGDPVPPKRFRQSRRTYRRTISTLYRIEREILHKPPKAVRRCTLERDNRGRFMPVEKHDHEKDQNDLGR